MATRQLQEWYVAQCDKCGRDCVERNQTRLLAHEAAVSTWWWKVEGDELHCPACVQDAARNKAKEMAHGPSN